MDKIFKSIGVSLIVIFAISGCSGLPEHMIKKVENIPNRLKEYETVIAAKSKEFSALKQSNNGHFLAPYIEREKWSASFVKAKENLSEAKDLYQNEILPLVDKDEPKDSAQLSKLILKFDNLSTQSLSSAAYFKNRSKVIISARDNAEKILADAKIISNKLTRNYNAITERTNQYKVKHPSKETDLSARLEEATKLYESHVAAMTLINAEHEKIPAGNTDYAVYADTAIRISDLGKKMQSYLSEFFIKSSQLDTSYTKVLTDQKIEYFVLIKRSSWCNGDYCYGENSYQYPLAKVDRKTFEIIDASTVDTLANLRRSWGSDKLTVNDQNAWKSLKIKPKFQWPGGDEDADYWIEQAFARPYHKYMIITDGKGKETDWEKISEDFYWQHYDNLGMAIENKPYGFYQDEVVKTGEPVGMATIAEPVMVDGIATGSNQYGEWRHQNGHSFWHYYGMYRLFEDLIGGHRYNYSDWSAYNQRDHGKPYFGKDNEYGTYGSATYSNQRYQTSNHVRSNPGDYIAAKTGASGKTTSSIRGAGRSNRSRGPSGGGK
jgi:hypothetical protein